MRGSSEGRDILFRRLHSGRLFLMPFAINNTSQAYQCKSCSDDDLPVPRFTVDPGDIMVEFSAPEDRVVRSGRANDRVYDRVNDRVNDKVNDVWTLIDREREVLSLLEEDPGYTVTQLAGRLSLSRKTISGYLQSLQKKGRICRIGSSRRGYWKINREESK